MVVASNRMQSINRNIKSNFFKYMALNPNYFKYVFPNMTIMEAWENVNKIKFDKHFLNAFRGEEAWPE